MNTIQLFEPEQTLAALRVIRADDQVIEVRVLDGIVGSGNWPATWSGYFNDAGQVIESFRSLRAATGVYITVNPVNPALLGRANNRLRKAGKGDATSDNDILRRCWLLIDTDAVRPAGISASDEEHALALERSRAIRAFLESLDWPAPIMADSGNGGHLMYRIDLPADDDGVVERCLVKLAERFSDARIKLDTTVTNPARIWKLYGTRAGKGDHMPDRPHRIARMLDVPEQLAIVPLALLTQVAGPGPTAGTKQEKKPGRSPFDVEAFIRIHSLDADGPHDWNGQQGKGRKWILNRSPLCDHHDGAAFIVEHATGAISAECHHNSCSWGWSDLRKRLEPVDETPVKRAKNRGFVASTVTQTKNRMAAEPYRQFPVDQLPSVVRDYVCEVAVAIGCDPAYVLLPTLACLARAIGNSRVIRLKSSWTEGAIIWAAIVGKSGTHKTPAIKAATQFLAKRQEAAIEQYEAAMKAYEQERAAYDLAMTQWKRGKGEGDAPWEPEAPHLKRYIVSDITVEAMADRMAGQYDGLLVVRDELAGWVNGIGEYKGAKNSDNGHWLATWSGAPMTVDRKTGDRKTIYIPRAAVSIVGGIQPVILKMAIGKDHMHDGLCARILLAMPEVRQVRWTDESVSFATEKLLAETFEKLIGIEPAADSEGRPIPYPIDLTPEARAVWIDYYNRHRDEQIGLDDDLAAAWSKLEAYTARFALIFQLCAWAEGDAGDSTIDELSMRAGIAVSDWFGGEARRVYSVLAESEDVQKVRLLIELIRRKGNRVTGRDLRRASRLFASTEQAEVALEELVQAGLGRWEPVSTSSQGGRPTREFQLFVSVDVDETH